MNENDPLWKLRHALAGLALALLLAVLAAAFAGRVLGDAWGGDYGSRVTVYGLLLVYVVVGAVVLFVKWRAMKHGRSLAAVCCCGLAACGCGRHCCSPPNAHAPEGGHGSAKPASGELPAGQVCIRLQLSIPTQSIHLPLQWIGFAPRPSGQVNFIMHTHAIPQLPPLT